MMRVTVSAMGTYELTYRVMLVDNDARRAVVAFEANNYWTIDSLTRIPAGDAAGESLLSELDTSIMSDMGLYFYWAEVIDF